MAGPWEQYAQPVPQQTQSFESAPWAANLSRQDQAKIQKDMYEEGRKRLAELQAKIADAGQVMGDLERFGQINRENSTGSLWQQITPDKALFRSGPSMEMASIQSRLAPNQRPVGSGSSSDRDVAMFLRSLPSLENDGNTNRDIRLDYERRYNAAIDKANAMQKHLDQYGNLTDFDSVWAQRGRDGKTQPAAQAATTGVATMRYNPKTGKLEAK